jgi:hypothetical protein
MLDMTIDHPTIIAGNPPEKRPDHLREFWTTMEYKPWWGNALYLAAFLGGLSVAASAAGQGSRLSPANLSGAWELFGENITNVIQFSKFEILL